MPGGGAGEVGCGNADRAKGMNIIMKKTPDESPA